MPHRRAEVEGSTAKVPALAGEAGGQLAGQGLDRLAHRHELLARGVHEVDIFGQRLANAAGESLRPAVGNETAPYLGLDLLLQLLDAAAVLVLQQPLLQPRQLAGPAPAEHVAARRLVAGAVHAGAVLAGRRGPRRRAGRARRRDRGSGACGRGSTCPLPDARLIAE